MPVLPSDSVTQEENLSEKEKARIRAEMRYAMLVTRESPARKEEKSRTDRILSIFNNSFILLIVGAFITYILVPNFQRQYENRKQRYNLMQECLMKYMNYSNSIWAEYHLLQPLTLETKINKERYLKYLHDTSEIKLSRYNSYANVQALALVFNNSTSNRNAVISALNAYAIRVNSVSFAIEKYAQQLYCTPENFERSACDNFDPTFNPNHEYDRIHNLVHHLGNEGSDKVAELMVKQINDANK